MDTELSVYNCRLINYPTGQHVTFYKRAIQKGKKNELLTKQKNDEYIQLGTDSTSKKELEKIEEKKSKESKRISVNNTKNRIYNIARSNLWEWFITMTFDPKVIDSTDYDTVVKRLHIFLNNLQKRKCPNMKYLGVPELHKDGKKYHFHFLLSDVDGLNFAFSGKYDNKGNPIFNILNWKFGFTTATRVKNSEKVSGYITKYITKESEVFLKEKNRYYVSRNIKRCEPEYMIFDEEEFAEVYREEIKYCKSVIIPQAYQRISYYEI